MESHRGVARLSVSAHLDHIVFSHRWLVTYKSQDESPPVPPSRLALSRPRLTPQLEAQRSGKQMKAGAWDGQHSVNGGNF